MTKCPISFCIDAKCSTSKARATRIVLNGRPEVKTPVFMPVGTKGSLKGVLPHQLSQDLDCRIMLSNTYHLGLKPGVDVLKKAGGLHNFMNWNRSLLTDSGGFQMVSLSKLSEVTEEGVKFESTYHLNTESSHCGKRKMTQAENNQVASSSKIGPKHAKLEESESDANVASKEGCKVEEGEGLKSTTKKSSQQIVLTPEHSIEIQNCIGADIIMQLDDVVDATHTCPQRFEIARQRTVRWLDRCIKAHDRQDRQCLFPIVQGGLDVEKRKDCASQLIKRDTPGFAVGGLSGGEAKDDFWKMVNVSTDVLPDEKPRYLMGVGHAVDLVVCSALGIDMFDCVFPTRTARFGYALINAHPSKLNLKSKQFESDFQVIEDGCECSTCAGGLTRAYLHSIAKESAGSSLVSIHNLHFQLQLMSRLRNSILQDSFPQFVSNFFIDHYVSCDKYPEWSVKALNHVGIHLMKDCSSKTSLKISNKL